MLWIGLTGGIGSGKSTVAAALAQAGAEVIDADQVAREVVAPGSTGLQQVVEHFGSAVLSADGDLDRAALGRIVFGDDQQRAALESITHPLIAERTRQRVAQLPSDSLVVHDVPLLVELGYAPRYHCVVLVHASAGTRLRRLLDTRGMSERDAQARIDAQASDDQRRAVTDVWLDNERGVDELQEQVDALMAARLVPFRDRLRDGAPVRAGEELAMPGWDSPAQRCERVRARVEHLVGMEVKVAVDRRAPAWTQVSVDDSVRESQRHTEALQAGGFVLVQAHQGWHMASADPGRPANLV